ncbi:MAG: MBL fold metallo-hydrolase [Syntrophales bacterium]|jgi:glyoxylase-like metal-dependent hydrolase (beta-lactamase superfamily II)|nr:MBL fold metallo-hydrolase [Syntrophales bacterium]MDY0045294.1 MBL fold metallo-hydrolase [Syntrophales bacterium]
MKVTKDLYAYEWKNPFENNCNSYYIGGSTGALIDPGLSCFFPDLLARMEEDGIAQEDIRIVINTHSHPDHFEASELLNGKDNVLVCMLKEEVEFYNSTGKNMYDMFGLRAPEITIDMQLKEGPVTFGSENFEVVHVPGHSPGSLALYWPVKKALFSGDVLFFQNVGRTDFPGGDSRLLKESITRLSHYDAEYLLPGHMELITGSNNVQRNFSLIMDHVLAYL